jgi:hypothetical protein
MTDTDDWINEDKDDLHDNGMRRYMENDDEEGWY